MKKTIAKHILGLIGTVILWFILNQRIDDWMGEPLDYAVDQWKPYIDTEGGWLLLGMIVIYFLIYWAVKTIWFDKEKD